MHVGITLHWDHDKSLVQCKANIRRYSISISNVTQLESVMEDGGYNPTVPMKMNVLFVANIT